MNRQHINTDNYEEYFLLYVDNELTAAEKQGVEAFVQQHPEYKDELQAYLNTRLNMENIMFNDKEMLFRNEAKINKDNIEALQVLLIDGELDPDTAAEVESFSSASPTAAEQLLWLRKAKLETEEIVFPNKSVLYRSNKKPAVLITMKWYRIAVAAAVLITAGHLWFSSANESGDTLPLAGTNEGQTVKPLAGNDKNSERKDANVPAQVKEEIAAQDKTESAEDQNNVNDVVTANPETRTTVKQKVWKGEQKAATSYAVVVGPARTNNFQNGNTTVKTEKNNPNIDTKAPEITESAHPAEQATPIQAVAMHVRTDYVSEAIDESNGAQEDIGDEEPKQRKGLRGLVRKANRIYNKVTNPDPERSSLVKVANFEIGLPR